MAAAGHAHIPYPAVIPFVLVLLGIAVLPLVAHHWWESNRNKAIFAGILGVPTALYLTTLDWHMLLHAGEEFFSFIALLGSLYIVSGGIVLRGDLKNTPTANAGLLAVGSVLASIVGTTGASMLLIRPFLRANRVRGAVNHLPIFFIFCVSNAGGLLTPLGDPPLFLGFLRGVPFTWTFNLVPEWLLVNGLIIAIFYVMDLRVTRQAGTPPEYERAPLSLAGTHNFIFLAGVVASAALLPLGWRELGMAVATIGSLYTTKKELRTENGFTYHPIEEVAILFAAIFVCMQPALALLHEMGPNMGLQTPFQFFWITGLLSSFLDNAPTYVTFFTVAQTMSEGATQTIAVDGGPISESLLTAISLGAVFMGANTYIGNGPNFMVKAICDEAGFKTPSFFGYMGWSFGILMPIWVVVAFVFL
ncbi:MAG: sodium:proton antiporter [Myxococcota bacterium]